MAYDEALAERIRELVRTEKNLSEMKMFGGLAFLINGNMSVAASGQGGMLVRVDPVESDGLVRTTRAEPMEMRGRSMPGWLRVEPQDDKDVQAWVARGVAYARSLPPKKK
jgi:TfoX-like protein